MIKALIFDCDGVLVDTERDGHRIAFNRAFAERGIDVQWDVDEYGELVKISGGKERMRYYFREHGRPAGTADMDGLIRELHREKTEAFMELIESGALELRPGVAALVDQAADADMKLGVCSTSNERSVNLIVNRLLGSERAGKFSFILAGDVVNRKKPDPEIYKMAAEKIRYKPAECLVIEDSRNGLLAAKAAGMNCIITKSAYTGREDFSEADAVMDELGSDVRLTNLINIIKGK
jgi:HAD superfamily hydrolase (TIGR01509 family)